MQIKRNGTVGARRYAGVYNRCDMESVIRSVWLGLRECIRKKNEEDYKVIKYPGKKSI